MAQVDDFVRVGRRSAWQAIRVRLGAGALLAIALGPFLAFPFSSHTLLASYGKRPDALIGILLVILAWGCFHHWGYRLKRRVAFPLPNAFFETSPAVNASSGVSLMSLLAIGEESKADLVGYAYSAMLGLFIASFAASMASLTFLVDGPAPSWMSNSWTAQVLAVVIVEFALVLIGLLWAVRSLAQARAIGRSINVI